MPALRGNLAFLHTQVSATSSAIFISPTASGRRGVCFQAPLELACSSDSATLAPLRRQSMVAQEEAQEEACAEGADGCHCCGNSNTAAAGQCQHRAVRPRAASKPKSRRRTMPGEGQGLGGKAP
eukprot:CAMPEP_0180641226 /NCGR_PEP_ID=MMETSP1037_2-20121125/46348_1 /TAXON_ID=632150 /ORGANISM="Azadinium spinosum, Strain 3D9" /LENGTH=123 /DNA_ID=CAMNT_0022664013 /DNA_START=165 /DNA_END=533 /DNA_ORIENTATION=-